jgi:plastocyanin
MLRATIRGGAIVAVVALTALVPLGPGAMASGGGGCGRPVTDARGTAVDISEYCFVPTVLRVQPGKTVTWTNLDPAHTVLGANGTWGSFAIIRFDKTATYRFARRGVYPYVCTLHPGMVGAIVVGDGKVPGSAAATASGGGPVMPVTSQPEQAFVSAPQAGLVATSPRSSAPVDWKTATLVTSIVLLGTIAAMAAGRKGRTRREPARA